MYKGPQFTRSVSSVSLWSAKWEEAWKWKWKSLGGVRLCNPKDYIVYGIFQARTLEWVAFPFSRGSSQPRDRTQVSHIAGGFFTSWATRGVPSERRPRRSVLVFQRFPVTRIQNPSSIRLIMWTDFSCSWNGKFLRKYIRASHVVPSGLGLCVLEFPQFWFLRCHLCSQYG